MMNLIDKNTMPTYIKTVALLACLLLGHLGTCQEPDRAAEEQHSQFSEPLPPSRDIFVKGQKVRSRRLGPYVVRYSDGGMLSVTGVDPFDFVFSGNKYGGRAMALPPGRQGVVRLVRSGLGNSGSALFIGLKVVRYEDVNGDLQWDVKHENGEVFVFYENGWRRADYRLHNEYFLSDGAQWLPLQFTHNAWSVKADADPLAELEGSCLSLRAATREWLADQRIPAFRLDPAPLVWFPDELVKATGLTKKLPDAPWLYFMLPGMMNKERKLELPALTFGGGTYVELLNEIEEQLGLLSFVVPYGIKFYRPDPRASQVSRGVADSDAGNQSPTQGPE